MSELLSYDEDAREAVNSVRHCLSGDIGPIRARVLKELADTRDPYHVPWPVCGDELTKRGLEMTTRECHHDTTTSHAGAQVICDRCEAVVGDKEHRAALAFDDGTMITIAGAGRKRVIIQAKADRARCIGTLDSEGLQLNGVPRIPLPGLEFMASYQRLLDALKERQ